MMKRIFTLLIVVVQIILLTNPFLYNTQPVEALRSEFGLTPLPVSAAPVQASPVGGPLRVSSENPRYLTDGSGKAVFLAGSNYWNLFQDGGRTNPPPPFDFDAFVQFAVDHGYNYMKPHVWEQAWHQSDGSDWYTQPTLYKRTGPGSALDGDPKFDLNQFNEAYFNRVRARVIQAGQAGIYVGVPLFDRFSVRIGNTMTDQWLGHPFHASNNINGIDGDPTHQGNGLDTETLIIPAVTAYQEAYVRHTIDVLNDLDNVIWEVAVEPDGTYSRNGYDAFGWVDHMLGYIHSYEATKPKQHPVLYSVFYPGGNNDTLFASEAEMVAPNGEGGFDHDAPVLDGSKVVLVDTDHIAWTETDGADWAWKAFTQGAGGFAIMDGGYSTYDDQGGGANYNDTENFRYNLGWILNYARRLNLAAMTPRPSLCSTGYCLAHAVASGAEYLAYLPDGGTININLNAVQGSLNVEWFRPSNGATVSGGTVNGGASRSLSAPFAGSAVLYLYANKILDADSVGVFRPSNGLLYLKNSNTTGIADMALNYGLPGDYPVVGDWDGNGTVTIGIYRNGYFYLRNGNTIGFAQIVFPFGQPGDQPIAGDWDGNGVDTIGVFRPSNAEFFLRNSNSAGSPDVSFFLGNPGDVGIAGDWTNKGYDTVGVFRPSNGIIFLKNTNKTGFADIALNYGLPGDKPVVGDWDNNGTATIGVYRNGQFMLRNSNTIGFAEIIFGLGNLGDMPIAGNWDALP